jgi:Immunity protein 22
MQGLIVSKSNDLVSVWVGVFSSEDALFDYVAKLYPGSGPATSAFLSDFPLGSYDEDFSEINFLPTSKDLDSAIGMHSYASTFSEDLLNDLKLCGEFNSLYLIYDQDASGLAVKARGPMRLLGIYHYSKT